MEKRIEDVEFGMEELGTYSDDYNFSWDDESETEIEPSVEYDLDTNETNESESLDLDFEDETETETEGESETEDETQYDNVEVEDTQTKAVDLEDVLGGYGEDDEDITESWGYTPTEEVEEELFIEEEEEEESEEVISEEVDVGIGNFTEDTSEYISEEVEQGYSNEETISSDNTQINEAWFDEDEGVETTSEEYDTAYTQMEEGVVEDLESVYGFFDKEGNPINARKQGTVVLDSIEISSIIIPTRNRTEPRDITLLEDNIKNFHQVSPIHVIPYGEGEYILLDGLRRIHALINLGFSQVIAYIDDTINYHAVRPFESIVNNKLQYTFAEKFKAGRFIEQRQDGFSYDTIENIVGLKSGEYLKMLYVVRMKDIFPDIYEKVILEKLTPEQAERKINKELEKSEDENNLANAQDELGSGEEGEAGKGTNDRDSEDPFNSQNKEERSILDSSLKTAVLTRDGGVCQCCGEGIGEPEVSQLMKIHHIVPVELFGPDRQDNLITLCANCHDKVHYYDEGRYKPDGELPNVRKNPIVLGNMLQQLRDEAQNNSNKPVDGMEYYDESPYEFFILSSFQSDFIEDAEDNVAENTYGNVKKVYTRRERPKLKNTKKDQA